MLEQYYNEEPYLCTNINTLFFTKFQNENIPVQLIENFLTHSEVAYFTQRIKKISSLPQKPHFLFFVVDEAITSQLWRRVKHLFCEYRFRFENKIWRAHGISPVISFSLQHINEKIDKHKQISYTADDESCMSFFNITAFLSNSESATYLHLNDNVDAITSIVSVECKALCFMQTPFVDILQSEQIVTKGEKYLIHLDVLFKPNALHRCLCDNSDSFRSKCIC